MTPALSFVCEARFQVDAPIELGTGADGIHRVIPIAGGTVTGPRLQGVVLPGGSDWQRIRPDGVAEIEARYIIHSDDDALISVVNRGLRTGPPEVMKRLAAGDIVDPALYYFRTAPRFQTASPHYGWLTQSLFLGLGERTPSEVLIRFWCVE
jgi:hypothetical protein